MMPYGPATQAWVKTDSGYGLLPDGTKPPEPILTIEPWHHVWVKITKKWQNKSIIEMHYAVEKDILTIFSNIIPGPMSSFTEASIV